MAKRLMPLTRSAAFYLYSRYALSLFTTCLEGVRRGVSLLGGSNQKCSLALAPMVLLRDGVLSNAELSSRKDCLIWNW